MRTVCPQRQSGATLIIALIILAAVTVAAAATLRLATTEQRITVATQARAQAFEAVEAALRAAEARALAQALNANQAFPNQGLSRPRSDRRCLQTACRTGLCEPPDPDCDERWLGDVDWATGSTINGVSTQYIVEFLGATFRCNDGIVTSDDPMNCKRYRITARSAPGNRYATVILQSVLATE